MKQRRFNYGQMYVALSRIKSLKGLYLIGEYNANAIKADPRAHEEYALLRRDHPMLKVEDCKEEANSLTITLLNTRAWNKHCLDVIHDQIIMNSDIIFLTETQVETSCQI